VLLLAALFLTAYSSRNPSVARIGAKLVLEVVAPVAEVADIVTAGLGSVWSRYVFLVRAAEENESLRATIIELEREAGAAREHASENVRLRGLLQVAADHRAEGIAASVIGGDPSGWSKGVVINRGSSSGVREGMAVIHAGGVVGQVIAVQSDAARVLLVSDPTSGVDVLLQDSRARGVLEGTGDNVCELKFISKDSQVKTGETIITSGMDGVFPKGILVGWVTQTGQTPGSLFQAIEVRPAVDFSKLEEVLLVVPHASSMLAASTGGER
jgi:rod shape-determining protein MreC